MIRSELGEANGRAVLSDFMRDKNAVTGEYSIVPTMFEEKNPSKNCYDCHKSPVLPVQPKAVYGLDSQGLLSEAAANADSGPGELNSKVARYGKCEFESMDQNAYGPCIGPLDRERSDSFIRAAAGETVLSKSSINRIRQAMNCSACHNSFAIINFPLAVKTNIGDAFPDKKIGVVQTFVENGWMPPRNNLSPSERHALWKCLNTEYFDPTTQSGVLIDWLRGGDPEILGEVGLEPQRRSAVSGKQSQTCMMRP